MSTNRAFIALILLGTIATSIRLDLTADNPSVQLVFETTGKHTFYAVSSGQEKHEVTVTIDYSGHTMYNQTGTDL
jgi:hypothetical protein